jgi:hypothetical protein
MKALFILDFIMNEQDKAYFLWGAVFGLIAPLAGLFIGLQVAPLIGTILMFPIILISKMVNKPFGSFSTGLMVLSFVFSVVVWALLYVTFGRFIGFLL